MKKLGFLPLFVVFSLMHTGAYAGSCHPVLCDEVTHDTSEMLSEDGYTGGENNNDDGRFSSKRCYMCDTGGSNECNYGDTVAILHGGNTRLFQCTNTTGVDDSWIELQIHNICTCGDSPISSPRSTVANSSSLEIRSGACNVGSRSEKLKQSGRHNTTCLYKECKAGYIAIGNLCVKNEPANQKSCDGKPHGTIEQNVNCPATVGSNPVVPKDPNASKCQRTCNNNAWQYKVTACVANYELTGNPWSNACQKKSSGGGGNTNPPAPPPPGGGSSGGGANPAKKTCWERRAQWSQEALRCCDTGKEANLTPKNDPNGKCVCVDSKKEFKIIDNRGVCVTKGEQNPVVPPNDDNYCNGLVSEIEMDCQGNNAAISMIAKIKQSCKSGAKLPEIIAAIGEVAKLCAGSATPDKPTPDSDAALKASRARIEGLSEKLGRVSADFDVSRWKNKDGDFNTARLASDSIAGVVLGTAGGLITSNVMKKNQIKGGFEDLKCTIGGQTVSDWGDEFRVGIQ